MDLIRHPSKKPPPELETHLLLRWGSPELYCYDRLLEQSAAPYEAITSPEDFHLTVCRLENCRPEVIFDLDYRAGVARLYRTCFRTSLWEELFDAGQARRVLQPVPAKRVSAEIPADHPLVRLVRNDHLFRMKYVPSGLDGNSVTLAFTHAKGCRQLSYWEGCRNDEEPETGWRPLLDALHESDHLLPYREPFPGYY